MAREPTGSWADGGAGAVAGGTWENDLHARAKPDASSGTTSRHRRNALYPACFCATAAAAQCTTPTGGAPRQPPRLPPAPAVSALAGDAGAGRRRRCWRLPLHCRCQRRWQLRHGKRRQRWRPAWRKPLGGRGPWRRRRGDSSRTCCQVGTAALPPLQCACLLTGTFFLHLQWRGAGAALLAA